MPYLVRADPRLTLLACSLLLQGCAQSAAGGAATRPAGRTSTAVVTSTVAPTAAATPSETPALHDDTDTPTATVAIMVRLLFTGDINPSRCPARAALRADDFTLPYRDVADVLQAADITVGSLDGALSDRVAPAPCEPEPVYNLVGPTRTVEGLTYAGFDLITLATNHALDCGPLGFVCDGHILTDTLAAMRSAGLAPVGAGADLIEARRAVIIERHGLRIAFLAVSAVGDFAWAAEDAPGTAPLSDAHLPGVLDDIAEARASADVVIVLAHWGDEYHATPSADQERWARRMIAAGASLIVGNHPHVVQPIEELEGGLVAYALGNFVFDQDPEATRHGLVLEAEFGRDGLQTWRTLPIEIVNLYRPEWR